MDAVLSYLRYGAGMKDRLFVFKPGFIHNGKPSVCPFSAQIVGYLAWFPQLRDTVDVVEIDYPKPRTQLINLLGEDHQSAPQLVIGDKPATVDGVTVAQANGHHYVEKTLEIIKYLAATRDLPGLG